MDDSNKKSENVESAASRSTVTTLPPLRKQELAKLVAGMGQWLSVGRQVLALHDSKRCVALLVPSPPSESILVPQVALTNPARAAANSGDTKRVTLAHGEIPIELTRINSVRLSQYVPTDQELEGIAGKGRALFRRYAWWLAAQSAEAGVCTAQPKEIVRLLRWPGLGSHVDRLRVMRLCTVLSRSPYCPRDLAILAELSPEDANAFITAGAMLRFVEATGEVVPGRHDGEVEGRRSRHPLSGLFSGIRRRFSTSSDQ